MASKHIGICRLCKQECQLKESHIVPKLFYNLIKKNSPTGRFRNANNPNIPYQDGEKLPFLCGECEEKFSKYETYFSKNIYQSFSQSYGIKGFESKGNEIGYFALSIAWRTLKYSMEMGIKSLSKKEYAQIDIVLEKWRNALFHEDFNNISMIKQYIVPTTYLNYFSDMQTRIISNVCGDFKVYGKEDEFCAAYTTVQVPYLIFVSMAWGEEVLLHNYEVGKRIIPNDIELPETLVWQLNLLHKQKFGEANQAMSDEQRVKITQMICKNLGIVAPGERHE